MSTDELKSWRKAERERLIAARERLDATTRQRFRQRIDGHLVTERGVYRRDPEGLVFLGEPGALASPVCYAAEIDPGHLDEGKEESTVKKTGENPQQ